MESFHDYLLDIDQVIFRGSNLDEVVFFHRASETVLFGDFIQRRGNEHEVMSTSTTWLQTFLETVAPASEPTSDEYCTPASWRWSFWWQGEQELARKALDLILNKWSPAQIVLGTSNTIIKEYATDMLERTLGSWIPEAKPYPTDFPVDQQDLGRETIETFYKNLPAIKKLKDKVDEKVIDRGYLIGIDGRHLQIRSRHSALNQLLQSTGSLCVKKATCILYEDLKENKLRWGIHYAFVAHIHDEIQALVKPQHVSLYKKLAVDCFRKSGEYFNLKCPLTGEVREGKNWMETH